MKVVFDGQLKAQDTVCMNLYKRLFPKWTYDPNIDVRKFKMLCTNNIASSQMSSSATTCKEDDVEM